jgi:hypothetical protein
MFPAGDTASGEDDHQGHHQPSDGTHARPQHEGPDPRAQVNAVTSAVTGAKGPGRGTNCSEPWGCPRSETPQVRRYATGWSAGPTLAAPSTAVVTANATQGWVPAVRRRYLLTGPVGAEGPVEAEEVLRRGHPGARSQVLHCAAGGGSSARWRVARACARKTLVFVARVGRDGAPSSGTSGLTAAARACPAAHRGRRILRRHGRDRHSGPRRLPATCGTTRNGRSRGRPRRWTGKPVGCSIGRAGRPR